MNYNLNRVAKGSLEGAVGAQQFPQLIELTHILLERNGRAILSPQCGDINQIWLELEHLDKIAKAIAWLLQPLDMSRYSLVSKSKVKWKRNCCQ